MPSNEGQRTVPRGAIITALAMVESLSGRYQGRSPDVFAREIRDDVEQWGINTITEALHHIIYAVMKNVRTEEGQPDTLHTIVPAVLTRLHRLQLPDVPEDFLPTAAGVLTAAFLGQNGYLWRTRLGPVGSREYLAWSYLAWLMVDLADELVFREPGGFVRTAMERLENGEDEDPT